MNQSVVLLGLSLLAMPALAATGQQEKMKACNAHAAKQSLKSDARKAFMKQCLGAKAEAKEEKKAEAKEEKKAEAREEKKALTPQQQKMKQCNAHAKAKQRKGDERKQFMSDCLKTKK